MGMDLKPVRPSKDAPLRADDRIKWGRYNLSGWTAMWNFLIDHGVDTSELSGFNDGARIKAATCRKIADTIEANFEAYLEKFNVTEKDTLEIEACKLDIQLWRTCGGYRQY
jgi:hypothetical protein